LEKVPERALGLLDSAVLGRTGELVYDESVANAEFLGDHGDFCITLRDSDIPHAEMGIEENARSRFGSHENRLTRFTKTWSKTSALLVGYPCGDANAPFYSGRKATIYWYLKITKSAELKRSLLFRHSPRLPSDIFDRIDRQFDEFADSGIVTTLGGAQEDGDLNQLLALGDAKLKHSGDSVLRALVTPTGRGH
jgi:hypothetical protein